MLKHFYKSFIVSIICGSLLSISPSQVFAAGTNSTDANGTITNTKSHKLDKVTDNDMLASLIMLGGGFIGARMAMAYRPITMDVTIAGAAGVAFIAGEVMSNMKFKGTIDEMTVDVQKKSDHSVNEEQIQRLQDLKKSYEEAKDTTETKKKLQLAAAVGFGVAAATALYLAMTEEGQIASCKAAMTFAIKSLTTCATSGTISNPEAPFCAKCVDAFISYGKVLTAYVAQRSVPSPTIQADIQTTPEEAALKLGPTCVQSAGFTTSALASLRSVCTPAIITLITNQTQANPKILMNSTDDLMKKILNRPTYTQIDYSEFQSKKISFFDNALDYLFPSAEASWLPMLGLTAGVAAIFIPMTAATAAEIDLLMYVPKNRAIAFGLFAGLSFMASKSSENVIAKLDENIKKIDEILNNLAKNAAGVKAQNLKQQAVKIKTLNPNKNEQLSFSNNGSAKSSCMQNNSSENCKPVTEELRSMPGFSSLPESFRDIASQTTGLADKLSGSTGLSGSSLAAADALGKKQKAVSNLLKGREAAYEKLNGNINFNKEQGKFLNKMKAAVRKSLGQKGTTATGLMSSIGSSPITGTDNLNNPSPASAVVPAGNVVDMSAKGEGKSEDDSLKLSFDEAPQPAVDMSGSVSGSAAPEYQIDSNEINGQNGPSIFEVISGRYIKSGYPKLLEEEPTKN